LIDETVGEARRDTRLCATIVGAVTFELRVYAPPGRATGSDGMNEREAGLAPATVGDLRHIEL